VDFKGTWTKIFGQPTKPFQGHLYTLTTVKSATGFAFTGLAKSRSSVVDHLEALRTFVANSNKILRFIRADNELITRLSRDWGKKHDISFQQSIPFTHNTARHVKRLHRTLQEMVVKTMGNKFYLTPQFWGVAYQRSAHLHPSLGYIAVFTTVTSRL
jgi:hypothetical protein